jgi:hypothetical protein
MSANIYRESAPPREMTESEYHMAGVIESLRERVADLEKARRECIATACLAALIASPNVEGDAPGLSEAALMFADELISKLETKL